MISPARLAAYDALRAISTGRATLPDALARIRPVLADDRDRALAAEIVTGTLRWRGRLDYIVQQASGRPTASLDGEILDILRLSAYQALHLDRVPAAAVVSDAVNLTRRARKKSAAGFVNGVLRTISRRRSALELPPPPAAPGDDGALEYLSTTQSHPRWLAERWLRRYGFEAARKWVEFNNTPARLTLRLNPLRSAPAEAVDWLHHHGIRVEPCRYAPFGVTVISGNPIATGLAGTGLFVVQDESSQLVAGLVGARPGHRVLDACASPGGKTTAMAADMNDQGLVVAVDLGVARLALLARTVESSGVETVRVIRADMRRTAPLAPVFDRVLLDAPCSGLGTIRRDPDIRWRRRPEDLPRFAELQTALLEQAGAVVRPGGRLVYSTCSSEPDENDDVIHAFLGRHPAFRLLDVREDVEVPPGVRNVVDDRGFFRTRPDIHRLEAFFGAVLERQDR